MVNHNLYGLHHVSGHIHGNKHDFSGLRLLPKAITRRDLAKREGLALIAFIDFLEMPFAQPLIINMSCYLSLQQKFN